MKRYSPDRDGAMDEYEDGDYVRAEDALALERERDQLRAMLAFADARINYMVEQGKSK